MSNNPIYQLDLAALRGYDERKVSRFPTPDVVIAFPPRWNTMLETMSVTIASAEYASSGVPFTVVPCDWLTPNPAPHFRFITTVNGHVTGDITVQGIPVEYADYAPILLRDGFEWVGVNLGSQRVSIERVVPPVGEDVPEGE